MKTQVDTGQSRDSAAWEYLRRWLLGTSPVDWRRNRWWLLRGLGLIYLIAFVSLWVQIGGLIGSRGVLPINTYLRSIEQQLGPERYRLLPTLCWISPSDLSLQLQCASGTILAAALIVGFAPAPILAALWILYLSLTVAGQDFLSFQWDSLLLEAGFLGIFLAPLTLLLPKAASLGASRPPVVFHWLIRWLLFRLMFLSGLVKLTSGDRAWKSGTALTYHYQTQPLPVWISWYAQHFPLGFQRFSVECMFVIELVLPFFIFGPRRLRLIAFFGIVFLQLLIMATGNYGFFNLLAIVLCLVLIDDGVLPKLPRRRRSDVEVSAKPPAAPAVAVREWSMWVTVPLAIVVGLISGSQVLFELGMRHRPPPLIAGMQEWAEPFRTVNAYGLFRVMTRQRPEIIVEGSDDGVTWRAYEFKWKPGDIMRRPRYCIPHMPRLDWSMWFAALDSEAYGRPLAGLVVGLLEGSSPVRDLLEYDPFAGQAPRYVRTTWYQYVFTTRRERAGQRRLVEARRRSRFQSGVFASGLSAMIDSLVY